MSEDAEKAVDVATIANICDHETVAESVGVDMGANHARLPTYGFDVAVDVAGCQSVAGARGEHEG